METLRSALLAIVALILISFYCVPVVESHAGHDHGHDHGHGHYHDHGHDHDHGHHHDHEPPSFKYSRQANQPSKAQQVHSHDHSSHGHHSHDHGEHSHGHVHQKPAVPTQQRPVVSQSTIWLYALSSTLAISLAPFLILFFIHIDVNSPYLRVLLAFASGGLLGDAFLHLIPHAVPHSHGHHEHSHDHHDHAEEEHDHFAHTMVGVWVVSGIISFLIVEKILRHMQGEDDDDHQHSHSHSEPHKRETSVVKDAKGGKKEKAEDEHPHSETQKEKKSSGEDEEFELLEKKKEHGDSLSRETKTSGKTADTEVVKTSSTSSGDIKVGGYLNLVADFAHNFTDGLAIGATFMAGQNIGLWTSFIILCHEIPHEIGDYALLVQSGCPRYKAIFLQLVTALGAFSGCFLTLFLGSSEAQDKSLWVIPFTAGGFIYIGTVTIIPELLVGGSVKQSIVELIALISGIGIMLVIAIYEGDSH